MNIIKHKLARSRRHSLSRHGLSVIEVLTSIVVALIGVFGVLAMIPFSVRQTQSGLDQDAATTMARSALSNFEASGYKIISDVPSPDNSTTRQLDWMNDNRNNVITRIFPGTSLVCIDPLGIAENGGFITFPFNNGALPADLTIPTVTLARPGVDAAGNPIPFTLADARRMFRLTDDLVFEQSDDPNDTDADLLGPVQIFNEDGAGPLNRQSNGTVSWCAIAEPIIANPTVTEIETYKFYVLVFKDRITDITAPESAMLSAPVLSPITFGQSTTVTIAASLTEDIRRDDWVMLINREAPNVVTDSVARRTNITFARVVNLFSDGTGMSSLSLDGPDFQFTDSGLASNGSGTPVDEATHIVHLRDVVAVYPRTIKLETASEWTVGSE